MIAGKTDSFERLKADFEEMKRHAKKMERWAKKVDRAFKKMGVSTSEWFKKKEKVEGKAKRKEKRGKK